MMPDWVLVILVVLGLGSCGTDGLGLVVLMDWALWYRWTGQCGTDGQGLVVLMDWDSGTCGTDNWDLWS